MESQTEHVVPVIQPIEARPVHHPLRFVDTDRHERFDHNRYIRIVRRHIYVIALVLGIALLLGGVRLAMATRIYSAEATLLVTAPEPAAVAQNSALQDGETVANPDYYQTQCDILKSRNLAERVVSILGLFGAPAPASADNHSASESDHERLRRAVDAYLGGLGIKPINEASLIAVEYRSPDPALAAKVANTHAAMFIKERLELLRQKKEDVADLLERKLVDLKRRLEVSELALNSYRRQHGIIPGLMSLDGKNAIVIDRLTQLSNQLTAAQVKRIGLESEVELIRKGQYSSLPAVIHDSMIQGLQRELDDLHTQDRTLSSRFTPNYPEVAMLHVKERGVQRELNSEILRQASSSELAYEAALKQENRLASEVDRQRSLTITLNDAGVKYAMLQREVDANRELYDGVLKGMKDARLAADSESSNVVIVDRAEVPDVPLEPRRWRIIGFSVLLGLFGGIGAALLLDYLHDPLDEPEDVARLFHLPTLAVIPRLPRHKASSAIENSAPANKVSVGTARPAQRRTSKLAVYASADEAYRHLRASLLASQQTGNYLALITSALPSEGKTQTAVNTAIMLALSGRRALLIDADLRRPRCHQYLGVENNEGLACVLSEQRAPDSLIQSTRTRNLYFLSSGHVAFNPSELLGSRELTAILTELRLMFDFVIIDSCPIIPVSDALIIAPIADGVALVVDANRTPKQMIRSACSRLAHARANIIGIVLNKTISDTGYYYRYSYA